MINESSRYANCVLYVDGSDEFIGSRTLIDTLPEPDDISTRFRKVTALIC